MTLESNDVVRFSPEEENDFGAAIGNPLLEALQDTWATVWAEYPEMTAGEVEELLRERTAETLRKLEEGFISGKEGSSEVKAAPGRRTAGRKGNSVEDSTNV